MQLVLDLPHEPSDRPHDRARTAEPEVGPPVAKMSQGAHRAVTDPAPGVEHAEEFAAATRVVAERYTLRTVSSGRIKSLEMGASCREATARCCALVVDEGMRGDLFPAPATAEVRSKIRKPDTIDGWETVRRYAAEGVPLAVFLHQRHYGGAFRQLLDATSGRRGDLLEDAVETLFNDHGVSFLRTGSRDQEEIARRFGVTVRPAPDFVVFDSSGTLRALLECKVVNDGGTARDKAARYATLRGEANRPRGHTAVRGPRRPRLAADGGRIGSRRARYGWPRLYRADVGRHDERAAIPKPRRRLKIALGARLGLRALKPRLEGQAGELLGVRRRLGRS